MTLRAQLLVTKEQHFVFQQRRPQELKRRDIYRSAKVNTLNNAADSTGKWLYLKHVFDKPISTGLARRFQQRNQFISLGLEFFDQTFRDMNGQRNNPVRPKPFKAFCDFLGGLFHFVLAHGFSFLTVNTGF
jgi:hypothetical protein